MIPARLQIAISQFNFASMTGQTMQPDPNPPKKETRFQKVLATKKVANDLQNVYETNTTTSSFLHLPPEVRNRIYHFLLGGKTMHIRYLRDWRGEQQRKHRLCELEISDRDAATDIKHAQAQNIKDGVKDAPPVHTLLYRSRHQHCNYQKLHLSILQVCREIHQEAALIPYRSNTFAAEEAQDLNLFLRSLILAQARSIQHLTIVSDLSYKNVRFGRLIVSRLKGLKHLTCFVESPVCPEFRERIVRSFKQFAKLPLVTATVVVAHVMGYTWPQTLPGDETCWAFAERVERKLLAASTGGAETAEGRKEGAST